MARKRSYDWVFIALAVAGAYLIVRYLLPKISGQASDFYSGANFTGNVPQRGLFGTDQFQNVGPTLSQLGANSPAPGAGSYQSGS